MLTQLTAGVLVHQSPLLRNNTVVVVGATGVLVVDAGITGDEMDCLATDLRGLDLAVVAGFATHPDWDHALWHGSLGDVPRLGTARCVQVLSELRSDPGWRARVLDGLPEEVAADVPVDLFGLVTALPAGAGHVPWDGPAVRVVEHPGHSPGHAALLVEAAGVLVAGDMLSDVFPPMLDDGDADEAVRGYLVGLDRLRALAGEVGHVVPGHGSVTDGDGLRRRLAADREYVEALRDGRPVDDPRVDERAEPGWEWVSGIHQGQVAALRHRFSG